MKRLHGFLIDPYQKTIHKIVVPNHLGPEWYQLLDADYLDVARVHPEIDIWVDEGLIVEPVKPLFKWDEYPNALAGYGLVLSSDNQGETISCTLSFDILSVHISFEQWEERVSPDIYIDQMMRVYPNQDGTFGLGIKR